MPHEQGLIVTLAAAFVLAFGLGYVASRLKLPPIVGYLIAGVLLGPFTPGIQADVPLASQLAEIGVILLMFGVGIHFSPKDLAAARGVIVPGAILQMAIATVAGGVLAYLLDMTWAAGIVFGLSLSVASTVVMLRALEGRGILDSVDGRLAVGWLVVEDVALVLALVFLPALAPHEVGAAEISVWRSLGITVLKVGAFMAVMLYAGRRFVPWLLERVARTGSRELFTLGVLAIAIGIALGAAELFGVSFALGAFFAGIVIGESDLSHQAAADALPLQDAFAVLFFVSVGMLVDPRVIIQEPVALLAVLLVIIVVKSGAAALLAMLFGHSLRTAVTLGASVGQIGEFSFILAALGVSLGVLTPEAQGLVLAGALLSITFNPFLFASIEPIERWIQSKPRMLKLVDRMSRRLDPTNDAPHSDVYVDHVIIVGFGRVGGTIGDVLRGEGIPFVVIERDRNTVEAARRKGIHAIFGDAARPGLLEHASIASAKLVVLSTPDPLHARSVIDRARLVNPGVGTVVRTHSEAELSALANLRVGRAFLGERELAFGMARYALRVMRRAPAGEEEMPGASPALEPR